MNEGLPKPKIDKTKTGKVLENDYYEIAPDLRLHQAHADRSYGPKGDHHPRFIDVFKDENGDEWYEIHKGQRKQMAVSLLAQPFFNVSPIVEDSKRGAGSDKFLRRVANIFVKAPRFFSKKVELDRMKKKDSINHHSDHLLFQTIFGDTDRGWKGHNVRKADETYAFFDFDHANFVPYLGHDYFLKYQKGGWEMEAISNPVILDMARTLKNMQEFYEGAEGENFFQAVLQKTRYLEEAQENYRKGYLKEEDLDPKLLYKGLLARVWGQMQDVFDELKQRQNIAQQGSLPDQEFQIKQNIRERSGYVSPDEEVNLKRLHCMEDNESSQEEYEFALDTLSQALLSLQKTLA